MALVCQRVFGTANVIARVHDPNQAESYSRLGIRTVCPTTLAASKFLRFMEEVAET